MAGATRRRKTNEFVDHMLFWGFSSDNGGMVMPMAAWWFLVRFYLCPSGEDVLLPTSAQVVRMRRCLPRSHVEWDVLFYLSWALGEDFIFLSFRGGGLAQRLALRLVLPVAHVLQDVYEVFGFPRPKDYMAKYSIIDAPTRWIWRWRWKFGTFCFQPDHCIYQAWVSIVRNIIV